MAGGQGTARSAIRGMARRNACASRAVDAGTCAPRHIELTDAADHRRRRHRVCHRRHDQTRHLPPRASPVGPTNHGDPARGAARRSAAGTRPRTDLLRGPRWRLLPFRVRGEGQDVGDRDRAGNRELRQKPVQQQAGQRSADARRRPADRLVDTPAQRRTARRGLRPRAADRRRAAARRSRCTSAGTSRARSASSGCR